MIKQESSMTSYYHNEYLFSEIYLQKITQQAEKTKSWHDRKPSTNSGPGRILPILACELTLLHSEQAGNQVSGRSEPLFGRIGPRFSIGDPLFGRLQPRPRLLNDLLRSS